MKKSHLVTICCLYFISATAQSQQEQLLEKIQSDNKKLERNLNEDFYVPKYEPPKQVQSSTSKNVNTNTDNLAISETNDTTNLRQDLYSKDPNVAREAALKAREIAEKDITANGFGMENKVKYQKGQEAFNGGYYGFNPNLTVEENKVFYASMGYTMSYKYSDLQIYTYIFGGIAFLAILGGGLFFWNKRIRWKEL